MAQQNEGKEWALRAIRPVVLWGGPFLTFLAGCFWLGRMFQAGIVVLLAFCAAYWGIGYIAYHRLCRIACMKTIGAVACTIPSTLFFLGALQLVGGRPLGLILLLSVGYAVAWATAVFLTATKWSIQKYADGYGRGEVDLERGLIDLTHHAKMMDAFQSHRSVRRLVKKGDLSPQEKRWFQKWGWLIGLLIAILPLWRALNITYIDEMSPVAQNLYGILIYYVMAAGCALAAGMNWTWHFLWRRWEKENDRPMLIKYLEDRYKGKRASP